MGAAAADSDGTVLPTHVARTMQQLNPMATNIAKQLKQVAKGGGKMGWKNRGGKGSWSQNQFQPYPLVDHSQDMGWKPQVVPPKFKGGKGGKQGGKGKGKGKGTGQY